MVVVSLGFLEQGFALGGQLSGSYVMMVEAAPSNRRGLYGALVSAAASVGAALAAGAVATVSGYKTGGNREQILAKFCKEITLPP